ncbi:MAG: hypothetical protein GY943_36945 [Chloroflexi bacterium]|nr:hypothetical protein [Chloroflexota bacterium]
MLAETAVSKLLSNQTILQTRLNESQSNNEAIANLLSQQEQLAIEARQWLLEFSRKHQRIQQAYTQITGEALSGG